MRKIIIAPNAFKGSLDASEICRIVSSEISSIPVPILSLPVGDGGDGTASLLAAYLKASPVAIRTCDALGRPRSSFFYQKGTQAIIELAEICGLKLLKPDEYDILNAHTAGLGIAVQEAVRLGAREILLCVGGSASVDGGTGALQAMGLKFRKSGSVYKNEVIEIEDIYLDDLYKKFKDIQMTVLCDVTNKLCGSQGAARVFGPQKGASSQQVLLLENSLQKFADILYRHTGIEAARLCHGGAAGGIAASFAALFQARLVSGAEYCLTLAKFNELLDEETLVITGEGNIDSQSLHGKIPGVIAAKCRRKKAGLVAIAGNADPTIKEFDRIFRLLDYAPSLKDSMEHPEYYIQLACQDLKKYLQEHV